MTIMNDDVCIIKRSAIPSIESITIDNKIYKLGIMKDLKAHPYLEEFIPSQCDIGISWVALAKDEILEPHTHPIDTMVMICKGQGKLLLKGDAKDIVEEGDIIAIPRNCRHGFVGVGDSGFWGVSLYFSLQALHKNSMTQF